MNILRSILAVAAGYVVNSALYIVMLIAALFLAKSPPTFTFKLITFVFITIAAIVAGYVTAAVAVKAVVLHALALGVIFLLLAVQVIITISGTDDLLISGVVQFIGAVSGGYLNKRFNILNLQALKKNL